MTNNICVIFQKKKTLQCRYNVPTVNLGIWMPPDHHNYSPHVEMAGPLIVGRFGWFIPKQLINEGYVPIKLVNFACTLH